MSRNALRASRRANVRASESETQTLGLGALPDVLGYALRRAQVAVFGDVLRRLEPLEIRPAQFCVLTLIDANPGVTQTQVCAALAIAKPNFAPLIQKLERRGLVRRKRVDGRSNGMYLTPLGRRVLGKAWAGVRGNEDLIATKLSPKQRTVLIDLLWRLADL
jgi:DNA-binding MarR family transcriptional regulator